MCVMPPTTEDLLNIFLFFSWPNYVVCKKMPREIFRRQTVWSATPSGQAQLRPTWHQKKKFGSTSQVGKVACGYYAISTTHFLFCYR